MKVIFGILEPLLPDARWMRMGILTLPPCADFRRVSQSADVGHGCVTSARRRRSGSRHAEHNQTCSCAQPILFRLITVSQCADVGHGLVTSARWRRSGSRRRAPRPSGPWPSSLSRSTSPQSTLRDEAASDLVLHTCMIPTKRASVAPHHRRTITRDSGRVQIWLSFVSIPWQVRRRAAVRR
jgi:hypothetical protein